MVKNTLKAFIALVVSAFVALPASAVHALTIVGNPAETIIENMADAESVDFSVDIDIEADNDHIDQPVTVHVDFEGKTDFERNTAFDIGFVSTDESGDIQNAGGSMIMIADTLYLSETGGDWYFIEFDSEAPTQNDVEEGVEEIQEVVSDLFDRGVITYSAEGSERVNGTAAVRYAYDVDMDRFVEYLIDIDQISETQAEEIGESIENTAINGNIWIDTSEMLPVKFTMNIDARTDATSYTTVDIAVVFNSFNEAVNISAPKNAISIEDADFSETEDTVGAAFELTVAQMDTDGDGLTNFREETVYNTNPFDTDSDDDGYDDYTEVVRWYNPNGPGKLDADSDGLPDSDERFVWKTDWLKTDTDGDGYSDYTEVVNGYNPNGTGKLDSDKDGLTDYAEMTLHWTNRYDSDSDNDGYADGIEIANGYNPNGLGRW